jgi:hypothetical protein
MGDDTPRAILVDGGVARKTIPLRTFDGAGTKESSLPLARESPLVKAKVRAGAEVAV